MNEDSPCDFSTRITASPGTPEYQRQLRLQTLAAADRAMYTPVVRAACGFFGLLFAWLLVELVPEMVMVESLSRMFSQIVLLVFLALAVVECGGVTLFGKSFYLRFTLPGVQRRTSVDDGETSQAGRR